MKVTPQVRACTLFLVVIAAAILTCVSNLGGELLPSWPMFGHDPGHTGRSEYKSIGRSNIIKWRFAIEGPLQGPVIGAAGAIYFGSHESVCDSKGVCGPLGSYLYSVNPTGRLDWKYKMPVRGIRGAPVLGADGSVYIAPSDDASLGRPATNSISPGSAQSLYAVRPDGTIRWKIPVGKADLHRVTVSGDGTIIVTDEFKKLYAIDPDGTLKWSYDIGSTFTDECIDDSYPAIASDGTVYIGSGVPGIETAFAGDEKLNAIAADGRLKWRFKFGLGGGRESPAIGADGTIYIGAWDGNFYAVNPDGSLKWKVTLGPGVLFGSPAIGADGTIYVANDDVSVRNGQVTGGASGGHFNAVSSNGKLIWRVVTDFFLSAPAISADGIIYVGSPAGSRPLYAFDPDGKIKWKLEGVGGQPAIGSDGIVYVGGYNGLYAIGSVGH
jgi:outer membrane protein assembly factor BamB